MNTRHYPTISEDQVLLINRALRALPDSPGFLTDPLCPYSQIVKDFLIKHSTALTAGLPVADLFIGDEVIAVERQVQKLISDLENFANQLSADDTSEKLQYFKTKTVLLEKLLTHLERAANLKQINEFRNQVIQFMDEVLDKDQITKFMLKIDGALSNGK